MPVPEQIPYKKYVADGSTSTFAYPFKIFEADQLELKCNGVVQLTGFSLTGVGDETGGSVVFSTNPVIGTVVEVERKVTYQRSRSYAVTPDFRGETVDRDFDEIEMQIQQQQTDINRALVLPKGDQSNAQLPSNTDRAGRLLAFDDSGNPTAGPSSIDVSTVTESMDAVNAVVASIDSIVAAPSAALTATQKATEAVSAAASASASAAAAVAAASGYPPLLPIIMNPNTVSVDTTIGSSSNALSIGPLDINTGITVTVQDGSSWTII